MPRKTNPKEIPISIKRITVGRLIGDEILKSSKAPKKSMSQVVAWSAFLGFIVGGGILVYFLSGQNAGKQNIALQIVIPKTPTLETKTPAPTPVAPSPVPVEGVVQKVEILDTPTGFLNVRSGPGTNSTKIGEAKPGDVFDLVSFDKQKGWYEIRWTPTSTGWVTKRFSRIIDNR